MTHLQITAVQLDGPRRECCRGLVLRASVGRGGLVGVSAEEVEADLRRDRCTYFVLLAGRARDVIVGRCTTCRAAYLRLDGDTGIEEIRLLAAAP